MFHKASIKDILFSNLFIALIGLSGFWRSKALWNLQLPLSSFYLVFFATFFIYSTSSLLSGSSNTTLKGYWNVTHPQWSKFGSIVSGLVMLGILVNFPELMMPLIPIGLLTFYYLSSSLYSVSNQKVYFKTTILSVTWWFVLDVYPLILSHTRFESAHYGWLLLDWAYIHLICFYFDHRDHSQENQPFLLFNQHKIPFLIPFICLLVFSFGAYFFYPGPFSNNSFFIFKSILFLFLLMTYPISIRTHSYWWFYFILDGSLASDALYFWYF